MMRFFQHQEQPDDYSDYSQEYPDSSRKPASRVGMYLAFMGFFLQSASQSLLNGVARVVRQPALPLIILLVSGSILALSLGWLRLPAILVDVPTGVSSEPVEMLAGNASDEAIVNPEIAALEAEQAAAASDDEPLYDLPLMPPPTAFAPLAFAAEGEFEAGAPVTFSIPDATADATGIRESAAGVAMRIPEAPAPDPTVGTVEVRTPDRADTGMAVAAKPEPAVSRSDDSTPVVVSNLPPPPLKPLDFAEVPPSFPGGKAAMTRFLNEQIRYPKLARENEIGGKVYTQFVVEANGAISQIKVVRGIGYGCDEEALRIIRLMPNWTPGQQGGQAVPVVYTLPVNFDFSRY